MGKNNRSSRRQFLGRSAGILGGALATPYFHSVAAAQDAADAPASDRPVVAAIGVGGQGRWIMQGASEHGPVAAVCDVDSRHARRARRQMGGKPEIYDDYRRVLDRKDVDVVTIGTPDHWHTKIAIDAMRAGKDVYCEKPLTLTIAEGQQICRVAKETGRVFQVGTQQRSEHDKRFLTAIALVRSGRLGKIKLASCGVNQGPSSPALPAIAPPKELNWDMWLGQTPLTDFRQLTSGEEGKNIEGFDQSYFSRCHWEFRWWYEYSGGKVTDWGAHHVDIAVWALGLDKTGPSSVRVESSKLPVEFKAGYPTVDDRYNTATDFHVVAQYPDVEIEIRSDTRNGVLFEGDKGRIFVSREDVTGKPAEELSENPLPDDALRQIYKGREPTGHMADFFNCVKSREEPISDVWSHHRALSTCHLANIALRLDREVKWDPEKEQVIGDDEAQSFVSRQQRKGYEIVG